MAAEGAFNPLPPFQTEARAAAPAVAAVASEEIDRDRLLAVGTKRATVIRFLCWTTRMGSTVEAAVSAEELREEEERVVGGAFPTEGGHLLLRTTALGVCGARRERVDSVPTTIALRHRLHRLHLWLEEEEEPSRGDAVLPTWRLASVLPRRLLGPALLGIDPPLRNPPTV